jgi:MinD superfamily P-loop ATPase
MRPMPYVDAELCKTCRRCRARRVCRTRAITQIEAGDLPLVEWERCLGCMVCVPECPHGAIRKPGIGSSERAT